MYFIFSIWQALEWRRTNSLTRSPLGSIAVLAKLTLIQP
ncbi:hypothetical protein CKA32_004529 [Geitlerinema sp. FC II]|nr:hypothetical protein CKA32_004529 [Geitlerinema sp. FC II]